jgi:hypothetical protein
MYAYVEEGSIDFLIRRCILFVAHSSRTTSCTPSTGVVHALVLPSQEDLNINNHHATTTKMPSTICQQTTTKNTDYKVVYWYNLHVILVRLICVQFMLGTWWWDSHRCNRDKHWVLLHPSFSRQIFVVSTQSQCKNQDIPKNFESQWESGMALQ